MLPLVFLHGFLGSGRSWQTVAESLSDRRACLFPDLPGHGANITRSLDSPLNFTILTDELARWLDHRAVPKIHLVGYSLGGRAALMFACRYPERVARLTLESASPGLLALEERQRRLEQDAARAETILREGLPAFLEKWYAMPLFASLKSRPLLLAALKQSATRNDPRWMAKVICALSPGLQTPLWEALPELSLPVTLIAGEKDPKYTQLAQQMAARLPGARVEIVARAGHNVHAEEPRAFRAALRVETE